MRRRRLSPGFESLEPRCLLAATVPDMFVVTTNGVRYSDGGLFAPQHLGSATIDQTGRSIIDLAENRSGDQAYRLVYHDDPMPTVDYNPAAEPAFFDTLVRVDPAQAYRLEGNSSNVPSDITFDLRYAAQDVDHLPVSPIHVNQFPGATDTVLIRSVSPGDSFIAVADANGWSNDSLLTAKTRALAWYGYQDATGTVYDDYTYTRNVLGDKIEGAWNAGGITFDAALGGYRIELSSPWTGAVVPSGAAVRNAIGDHGLLDLEQAHYDIAEDVEYWQRGVEFEKVEVWSSFGGRVWNPQRTEQAAIAPGVVWMQLGATQPIRSATIRPEGDETVSGPSFATFDGDLRYVASRSLDLIESDLPVTIDTADSYLLSAFVGIHQTDPTVSPTETHSIGYTALDADGLRIDNAHVARFPGSEDTTLSMDLSPGDLQIRLSDATGWSTRETDPATRMLAWYGYANANGEVYDDYTYTRNVAADAVLGLWSMGGIDDNTIQLNQPWSGPALVAGTAVRNAVGGPALQPVVHQTAGLTTDPQRLASARISGTWGAGIATVTAFPPATATIRPAAILNQSNLREDDIVTIESFAVSQVDETLVMPSPTTHQYTLQLDVLANDPISATADVELVGVLPAQFGTVVVLPTGLVQYQSAAWFVGKDQFTYVVRDSSSGEQWFETASVAIRGNNGEVDAAVWQSLAENESNQPLFRNPTANDDGIYFGSYRTVAGQSLVADGIQNVGLLDSDDQNRMGPSYPAPASLVREPEHGVLNLNFDGTFSYKSDPDFIGLDFFQYSIFDGLRTDTATVTIQVFPDQQSLVRQNLSVLATGMNYSYSFFSQFPVLGGSWHADAQGRPFLSWRVHLLPFLNYHELHAQFHLDEPWDSTNNLALLDKMPDIFGDGLGLSDHETRIQTLTSPYREYDDRYGPVGFNLDRQGIELRDILDGTSNTLMLVQTGSDRSVPWTAPLDAAFDYAAPLNTLGTIDSSGIPVVMFDGTPAILPANIDAETFASLATRASYPSERLVDVGTLLRQVSGEAWDADGTRQDLNFRSLGLALHNHHGAFNQLPPNDGWRGRDQDGHFQLSWRVYLLPFIEQQPLYERFNLEEPWDSPNNIALLDEMPDIFRSSGDPADSNTTRIKVVSGDGAAYGQHADGSDRSAKFSDFHDGLSNTLLAVETGPDQAVLWTKPDEFEFDPNNPLANLGNLPAGFFRALLADGSLIKLPANIDSELFVALATKDSSAFYDPQARPSAELVAAHTLRRKYSELNPPVLPADHRNQFKQIGLGWYNYHSAYNQFPTLPDASYFDADGKPLLSWRVQLLPFMGHRVLWEAFHQDEPWDSPHNLSLLPFMPDVYRSARDDWDSVTTRMQTFVDGGTEAEGFRDGALFRSTGPGLGFHYMRDGVSATLLMVEAGTDVAVPWTKPADLTFDPNAPFEPLGNIAERFLTMRGDGSVHAESANRDSERFADLIRPRDRRVLTSRIEARMSQSHVLESNDLGKFDVWLVEQDLGLDIVASKTVEIVVADPTVLSVYPATLSFSGVRSEPIQSVTFQAVDNGLVDGPRTTTVTIGEQSFEITVIDDDSYQLVLDDSPITVAENGSVVTRVVSLDAAPTAEVIVHLTSADPGEVVVSPATLSFDAQNWNIPQAITMAGVDDVFVDGDIQSMISVSIDAASDAAFAALPSQSIDVTTTDDDIAGFIVIQTGASTLVSEAGDQDTFTVKLAAAPLSDVTINVTATDATEISLSASSVVFTSANWNVPQSVTVSGADDVFVDGDVASTIIVSIGAASDAAFANLPSQSIDVTTTDDDTAGFIVTETDASTIVSESGVQDTFTIQLSAAPLSDVTVNVAATDTGEISLSKSSVVFTPANWNVPQSVTVSGVDDMLVDGHIASIITVSIDPASDAAFANLPSQSITVTTTDDDTAGFIVTETDASTIVSESGDQDPFTVQLSAAPLSDVTINVVATDASEVSLSTSNLVFTPANWDIPQAVTVSGVDDLFVDGDIASTIIVSIGSASDAAFLNLPSQSITVTTTDDDVAGFIVTETDASTVVSESGDQDTFTVQLSRAPLSDVTINVAATDTSEISLSTSSVVFTSANWNVPQAMTVSGVDDLFVDGDITSLIIVSIDSASNAAFVNLASQSITVTTTDEDTAGFVVTETDASTIVSESGVQDTFTVQLSRAPLSDVTINVVATDASEISLSASSVVFTSANWNVPQFVTVSGVDDFFVDGVIASTITVSIGSASDAAFLNLPSQSITVTTTDDDTAGFVVAETDASTIVSESGDQDTFIVQLSRAPLSDVTIKVAASDTSEISLSTSSVVFTSANWNVPQAVTVSGVDDLFVDGDITSLIIVSIDPASNAAFVNLASQSITVTTTDDDTAGFVVTETGTGTIVSESGAQDTFTVQLSRAPLSDVIINVAATDASEVSLSTSSVVYTPANWDIPQVVTVSGVDDLFVDGDIASTITVSIGSASDAAFLNLPSQSIDVTTTDDDIAGFIVTETGTGTVVSESGAHDTFTVQLSRAPLSDVTINVVATDASEISLSASSLVFTSANWNIPQSIHVAGEFDFEIEPDASAFVVISVNAASDSFFTSQQPKSLRVDVVDFDDTTFLLMKSDQNAVFFGNDSSVLIDSADKTQTSLWRLATGARNERVQISLDVGVTVPIELNTGDGDDTIEISRWRGDRFDGGEGFDRLRMRGAGETIDLATLDTASLARIESVDIRGSGSNRIILSVPHIRRVFGTPHELTVVADSTDSVVFTDSWTVLPLAITENTFVHQLVSGDLTLKLTNQNAWQNPFNALDVDRSGFVSGLDALKVINYLSDGKNLSPSVEGAAWHEYYDVSGDGRVTPLDALQVINALSLQKPVAGIPQGEQWIRISERPKQAKEKDQPETIAIDSKDANSRSSSVPISSAARVDLIDTVLREFGKEVEEADSSLLVLEKK